MLVIAPQFANRNLRMALYTARLQPAQHAAIGLNTMWALDM